MRVVTGMRAALVAALALTLAVAGVSSASAHSDTFQSVPAAGSTSATVTQIQFTFAEPVQKTMNPEVVLQASGGVTVATGAPTFDITGATMTVPITGGALPNGTYGATYRVVSIDGHVASGVLNFTVAGSSAGTLEQSSRGTTPITVTIPTDFQSNDVPLLSVFLSIAAVVLILSAVIVVIVRRRRGKF